MFEKPNRHKHTHTPTHLCFSMAKRFVPHCSSYCPSTSSSPGIHVCWMWKITNSWACWTQEQKIWWNGWVMIIINQPSCWEERKRWGILCTQQKYGRGVVVMQTHLPSLHSIHFCMLVVVVFPLHFLLHLCSAKVERWKWPHPQAPPCRLICIATPPSTRFICQPCLVWWENFWGE